MITEDLYVGSTMVVITKAYRCREWIVLAYTPMGRCGYCGEKPVIL